ncbi:MAG: DsbC family protein [Gammaproteobacteria bacterium]|nr:DsbC family protein [Gammaproteobacteria bacterium]
MRQRFFATALCGVLFALSLSPLTAADAPAEQEKPIATVRAALKQLISSDPDSIQETPIKGLYEVTFGVNVYYVSADGRYLMDGSMRDLSSGENLTQLHLATLRQQMMQKLDPKSRITYAAVGEEKFAITVFTDIDCSYCRKLHSGMAEMNKLGITVHYLAMPRAGVGSDSYDKAVSVWCAADRNKAMDKAKNSGDIERKSCDNPVANHMELASDFGVSGTPALILGDGELIPGYLPPQRLLQLLEEKKAK